MIDVLYWARHFFANDENWQNGNWQIATDTLIATGWPRSGLD